MNKPELPESSAQNHLMGEAHDHLKRILHYADICHNYAEVEDGVGFVLAGEKLLFGARELSKILKAMRLTFGGA